MKRIYKPKLQRKIIHQAYILVYHREDVTAESISDTFIRRSMDREDAIRDALHNDLYVCDVVDILYSFAMQQASQNDKNTLHAAHIRRSGHHLTTPAATAATALGSNSDANGLSSVGKRRERESESYDHDTIQRKSKSNHISEVTSIGTNVDEDRDHRETGNDVAVSLKRKHISSEKESAHPAISSSTLAHGGSVAKSISHTSQVSTAMTVIADAIARFNLLIALHFPAIHFVLSIELLGEPSATLCS